MNTKNLKKRVKNIQKIISKEIYEFMFSAINNLGKDNIDLIDIENDSRFLLNFIGSSILNSVFEIIGTGYEGRLLNCKCGKKLEIIGNREKRLTTLSGEVKIKRAYYYCKSCGLSYIPIDKKYDIENTGFSPGVRDAVNYLSSKLPFNSSSDLLLKLLKLKVSKDKCKKISETTGLEVDLMLQERDKDRLSPETIESDWGHPERIYISADGTMVNTTKGWKEAKVGVIFTSRKNKEGKPIKDKAKYLGGFESSKDFGDKLFLASAECGIDYSKEVIVIGDGAKWIWNEADMHFPSAVQIVDWYHSSEHLWDAAKIIYEGRESKINNYAEKLITFLNQGNIDKIIQSLKRVKPKTKKIFKKINETIGYFTNNKNRMRYEEFKKKGYFIGSGIVESACKYVVAKRLKQSGMIWLIAFANAILQLRICFLNKQINQFYKWRKYKMKDNFTYK